jgi:hypothetical protein
MRDGEAADGPYRAPSPLELGTTVAQGSVVVFGFRIRTPNRAAQSCAADSSERGARVVAAEDAGPSSDIAGKLGVEPGMVVQELGYDSDVDDAVRDAVEDVTGEDVLEEDAQEVVDLILLWFREGDGDLVDTLVDARGMMADEGTIWVLTPKTGRSGHLEPSEIAEAAPTAGLAQTSNVTLGDWVGARLVPPKAARKRPPA